MAGRRTERRFQQLYTDAAYHKRHIKRQRNDETGGKITDICQVAVDLFEEGLIEGSVQNAVLNHIQAFRGIVDLADAMGNLFEIGVTSFDSVSEGKRPGRKKIATDETWKAYRKGGKKRPF